MRADARQGLLAHEVVDRLDHAPAEAIGEDMVGAERDLGEHAGERQAVLGAGQQQPRDPRRHGRDDLGQAQALAPLGVGQVLARLQRAGMRNCSPKLNPKGDPGQHLSDKGAPWKKLANEKPKGITMDYDELVKRWTAAKLIPSWKAPVLVAPSPT